MPFSKAVDIYQPFRDIESQVHYLLDPICLDTHPQRDIAADLEVASQVLVRLFHFFSLLVLYFNILL
jgi:hypothetical protein